MIQTAGGGLFDGPPPLSLYVHIPWCLRKCPYCDFNSHQSSGSAPEAAYLTACLHDLDQELDRLPAGTVSSIFIGGGTPSLVSGAGIASLLDGLRRRLILAGDAEVTLEANPGASDARRFAAYREAGVNRLSIGVQSLDAANLRALGRIHDPAEARAAVAAARQGGFDNLNLDLMYALPHQDLDAARRDLERLIDLEPEHLSYYQLTLEPNTAFAHAPPTLPDSDLSADMQEQGIVLLSAAGYGRYEVSAYARTGRRCRHNLNYWSFGDYIGIGAGAHGKRTQAGGVERLARRRSPTAYMDAVAAGNALSSRRVLMPLDLRLELALNAFRLCQGFPERLFAERAGADAAMVEPALARAESLGLLERKDGWAAPTELGMRFTNDLVQLFAD